MKQRTKVNIIFILSVLLMVVLISIPFGFGALSRSISNTPDVIKAEADFSNVNINRTRGLYLSGEWLRFDGHIVT